MGTVYQVNTLGDTWTIGTTIPGIYCCILFRELVLRFFLRVVLFTESGLKNCKAT